MEEEDLSVLMESISSTNQTENDKMEITEEEDYVVQEVDVFWTTELADQLCLFQHPLRPVEKPYPQEKLSALRFKPTQYKFGNKYKIQPTIKKWILALKLKENILNLKTKW